jgi:hypothetical protein
MSKPQTQLMRLYDIVSLHEYWSNKKKRISITNLLKDLSAWWGKDGLAAMVADMESELDLLLDGRTIDQINDALEQMPEDFVTPQQDRAADLVMRGLVFAEQDLQAGKADPEHAGVFECFALLIDQVARKNKSSVGMVETLLKSKFFTAHQTSSYEFAHIASEFVAV